MAILDFLGGIFKPAADIVDSLHTSGEEKLEAKAKLLALEASFVTKALEYEATIAKEQSAIIQVEAASSSWLPRNIRPLMMAMFGYIVLHNYVLVSLFGLPVVQPADLPDGVWSTIQLGMGGYIGARTIEKVVPGALKAWREK